MTASTSESRSIGLPTIVYVAGYGRSGSTILDAVIGNHPQALGGGELHQFFDRSLAGLPCSCGRSRQSCESWRGLAGVGPDYSDKEVKEVDAFNEITGRLEAAQSLERAIKDDPSSLDQYIDIWVNFFRLVANSTGSNIVVDSSKTAHLARNRIELLSTYAGLDVRVVHLVRDPRAVMASFKRGDNRRLEEGGDGKLRFWAPRALVGWARANRAAETAIAKTGVPSIRINYEHFACDPGAALGDAGDVLSLDMSPLLPLVAAGRLEWGCGFAGNRARRGRGLAVRPDFQWVSDLSEPARAASLLVAAQARRYGYNVWSRPEMVTKRTTASTWPPSAPPTD